MLLRFGESPLKTDNVNKEWTEQPLYLVLRSDQCTDYFLQKSHANSMATDVAFRESLLKLQNSRKHQISFSLMIVFWSGTGTIFLQMSRSMIFLSKLEIDLKMTSAQYKVFFCETIFFCEINISLNRAWKLHAFLQAALPQCCSIIVSIFQKPGDILICYNPIQQYIKFLIYTVTSPIFFFFT